MNKNNHIKKKILILTPYYVPGVKGGGPIQSIKNITDHLSDLFDFYIITADRDFRETNRYEEVKVNTWMTVDNAKVYYMDMDKYSINNLSKVINSIEYDTLYLNGFFEFKFSIAPLILMKIKKIKKIDTIVAPRGEFSKGALNIKKIKKKMYIIISKLLGIYSDINWHATTDLEEIDIIDGYKKNNSRIFIANNLGKKHNILRYDKKNKKDDNMLKLVFLSRISVKKNLKFAIQTLSKLQGNVKFDIYGPIEDAEYWEECKKLINCMPPNIHIEYKGILNNKDVTERLKKYDIFYLPTYGENFGHVILEALISGCPIIISDQTPWLNLQEKSVGWDINLQNIEMFESILQYCVNMKDEEYKKISKQAFEFGIESLQNTENIYKTKNLFELSRDK